METSPCHCYKHCTTKLFAMQGLRILNLNRYTRHVLDFLLWMEIEIMLDRSVEHALYQSSVAQLTHLIEQAPEEIQQQFHGKICYHIYAHQPKQEIITWAKAIRLYSPDKDFANIIAILDLLVQNKPDNAWSYVLRARALWGIQYYAAAFQDLHKAICLDNDNYTAKVLFCYTLLFLNRLEEAELYALKLRSEFGNQFPTLLMLHFLYEKRGIAYEDVVLRMEYFNEALKVLREAKLLYPMKIYKIAEHEERILERLEICKDNP